MQITNIFQGQGNHHGEVWPSIMLLPDERSSNTLTFVLNLDTIRMLLEAF